MDVDADAAAAGTASGMSQPGHAVPNGHGNGTPAVGGAAALGPPNATAVLEAAEAAETAVGGATAAAATAHADGGAEAPDRPPHENALESDYISPPS